MGINSAPKIGFTCGTFDLVHAGHVIHFEECKKYCDYLIVGIQTDPSIDRPEKNKPVMSLEERYRILRANKWVDAIIVYEREKELIDLEKWLPVDFRFRGIEHKGEKHYFTRGKFIDIVGDNSIHSSSLRRKIYANSISDRRIGIYRFSFGKKIRK